MPIPIMSNDTQNPCSEHGLNCFLVGGAVRDRLLGNPVHDRDWVVVGATEAALLERGFRPVGRDFPVFLHPKTQEEYALARTERKAGKGHRGFKVHAAPSVTLDEDLARRDLTINAMAMDSNGRLIDPWGGEADLKQRLLRHVSPAFADDPLRVLRVARFHARFAPAGFRIALPTLALMNRMVRAGELDHLTPERVWLETEKALASASPATYFRSLRQCGALAVLFPEIEALFGVPQTPHYHPEIDSGVHSLMVLEQAARLSKRVDIRLAALLHDLGKALTPPAKWPRHIGHESAGVPLIRAFCERLRVPTRYRELAELVGGDHMHVHRAEELRPKTLLRLLERWDSYRRPERVEPLLIACQADARGRPGHENAPYPQADFIREIWTQTAAVQARPFVEAGLRGNEVRDALRHAREAVIKRFKATPPSMPATEASP